MTVGSRSTPSAVRPVILRPLGWRGLLTSPRLHLAIAVLAWLAVVALISALIADAFR
jgi:hypothetical protein